MEPILQQPGTSKCLEILFFPEAELQKLKGGQISFAVIGPLSVLYSKDYNRFFIRLDDWFYPLMRRLPVVGMNKNDGSSSRVYCFPGHNGFWYNLRVNCYGSSQGLENFESILQEYTKFSWKGEAHHGRVEQSPDDKIVRRQEKEWQQTEKDIKQCHPRKVEMEGETETKNLTSRKEPMDLRDIKYRNFRKEAKSTIGKNFIDTEKKSSQEFINLRKANLNVSLSKSLEELLKTTETQVPALYLPKEELEDAILDFRDFATQGNIKLEDISEEITKVNLANSTKGHEILFFEDAELWKCKDRHTSIAGSGPLSVLYFKNYRRFFLCLDNWFYPLMRRLPVIGMDKTNGSSSRMYCLPGLNGFCYNLRVNCYGSPEALENFESILQDCTKFSWKGEAHKGRDESPGDHLTRKKGENIKKKAFEAGERVSEEFQNLRRINLNMTMPKTFFDLTQTPESQVPSLYFPVQEVEDAILDYRDVATKGNFNLVNISEQTISKESNSVKGLEMLFFEDAQLQRGKGDQSSLAASGPLSVLYFKEFNRFFLCLDDWVYPLMKRLPIMGMDKVDGSSSRVYCLPGQEGSCWCLRVNCYGSPQALENLESILEDCSKFSWKGEVHKGKEQSPDDKLSRKNIKDEQIKKDFQSRLNKETLQSDFLNLRRTNLNIILPRTFQDLVKTKESKVPSLFFPRDELEEIILNYRDVATQGNWKLGEQKHGFIESIKQGVQGIKEAWFGTGERGRETIPEDKTRIQQMGGITEVPPS